MKYQIDQSGKIEQTERHTVVACTNGSKASIFLNRKEKRILQKMFKQLQNQKFFPYLTFAALIAIVIKEIKPKYKIIVDKEYEGHENLISERVNIYLEQLGYKAKYHLVFGHVGKTSNAHNYAYQVAIGKIMPTKTVNAQQILEIVLGTKKDR